MIFFLLVIYGGPVVAILALARSRTAQLIVLGLVVTLLLWDLMVAAAPEGGDRKGCVNCEFPAIVHLLFGFLCVLIAMVSAGISGVLRLFRRES